MKKFEITYKHHEPYIDWETEPNTKREHVTGKMRIYVLAENAEKAENAFLNNIKYPFTDYDTIESVKEVPMDYNEWLIDTVNPDGSQNWKIEKKLNFI